MENVEALSLLSWMKGNTGNNFNLQSRGHGFLQRFLEKWRKEKKKSLFKMVATQCDCIGKTKIQSQHYLGQSLFRFKHNSTGTTFRIWFLSFNVDMQLVFAPWAENNKLKVRQMIKAIRLTMLMCWNNSGFVLLAIWLSFYLFLCIWFNAAKWTMKHYYSKSRWYRFSFLLFLMFFCFFFSFFLFLFFSIFLFIYFWS